MIADVDLERAVLGAVILQPDRLDEVRASGLRARHFSTLAHVAIFRAMVEVAKQGGLVHPTSLASQLREMRGRNGTPEDLLERCGGIDYLLSLQDGVSSGASAAFDACRVIDLAARRRVKEVAEDVARQASQPGFDAKAEIHAIEKTVLEALEAMAPQDTAASIRSLTGEALRAFEAIQERGASGLKTGFSEVDRYLGGILPGSFVLVAGRPGMGKTTFAVGVAENVARTGGHVLFCSAEVSGRLLVENLVCSVAHVQPTTVRAGRLAASGWQSLAEAAGTLSELPLTIDSSSEQSVASIAMSARRAQQRQPLALIVVDYLQLLRSEKKHRSRYEEVTELSRDLKGLARLLDVPILAVSQLNREADKRKGGRPQISDLRDSGAAEQDADQVLLIYREEYYEPDRPEARGLAEVLIAKNRHGPTGSAELGFLGAYLRFTNLARIPYQEPTDLWTDRMP